MSLKFSKFCKNPDQYDIAMVYFTIKTLYLLKLILYLDIIGMLWLNDQVCRAWLIIF